MRAPRLLVMHHTFCQRCFVSSARLTYSLSLGYEIFNEFLGRGDSGHQDGHSSSSPTIKDLSRDTKGLGKKVNSKFDRLMYFTIRGVVVKAGFDLYINERS